MYRISSNKPPGGIIISFNFLAGFYGKKSEIIRGDPYHFWKLREYYLWGGTIEGGGALLEEIRYFVNKWLLKFLM